MGGMCLYSEPEIEGELYRYGHVRLAKAFDTVDHDILLMKLKCLGLNDVAVNWIRSYLTNIRQVCNVGDVLSEAKEISCGVQQGYILGPILFTG